jgi:hypothetical protein
MEDYFEEEEEKQQQQLSSKPQQMSPQQTLASENTNPLALPSVFSEPKKEHKVRQM